jgi:threonine dehydratase
VAATPLEPAPPALAAFAGRDDLWLKREDVHELGAFKWRAALPVVGELVAAGHASVVTASTGNHGAAVAWACRRHGATAIVFVPPDANQAKLALLRGLGADVRVAGRDLDDAKAAGIAFAAAEGLRFFEDGAEPRQYEAYGAIGDELVEQSPSPPAAVVTPVGNGALAIGVGEAVGRRAPGARRIGVVAHALPVMAASWEAGRPVKGAPGETIADGLAVRVAIPLAVERLRDAVDAFVRVSERELAAALVACHHAGVEVEPSGAAGIAAVRARPDALPDGPVVLVATGRNTDPAVLARARADLDSFPQRD